MQKLITGQYFSLVIFAVGVACVTAVILMPYLLMAPNEDAEGVLFLAFLLNTAWVIVSFVSCTVLFSLRWRRVQDTPIRAATQYGFAMLPASLGLNLWSSSPAPLSAMIDLKWRIPVLAISLATVIYFGVSLILGWLLFISARRSRLIANLAVLFVLCFPPIVFFGVPIAAVTITRLHSNLHIAYSYRLPAKVWASEVAVSPDGSIWAIESVGGIPINLLGGSSQTIYRFDASGRLYVKSINGKYWKLHDLTAARDGSIWFIGRAPRTGTDFARDDIIKLSPAGAVVKYAPPTPTVGTTALIEAPDGVMWFLESQPNIIGSIDKTGRIIERRVSDGCCPTSLALDHDRALWYTVQQSDQVGRMDQKGKVTVYNLPHSDSWPDRIVLGPDGAMWFTEYHGNRIGRINDRGRITEINVGARTGYPQDIVAGHQGDIWFSANGESALWKISQSAKVERFPLSWPFTTYDVQGLAVDRDGNVLVAATAMTEVSFIYEHQQGYVARAGVVP